MEASNFASDIVAEMLKSENKISPDKGLALAQLLLSEGPDFQVDLLLNISEAIMVLSANAGSSATRAYLNEQWPTLRGAHKSRLLREREKNRSIK